MGSPRPVGRGRRLVAIAGSAALTVGLVSLARAAGAAAVRGGGAAADQRVAYEGYTFAVPDGWKVVNLAANPRTCVRFDVSAVYLGTPGANQACPAKGVGDTTQAILIQPAAAATTPRAGADPAPPPPTRATIPARAANQAGSATSSSSSNAAPASATPPLSPTNETGKGFDACTAPSSANMSAWKSDSPYSAVGIYIGGPEMACSQPNLTASWVSTQSAAGWSFIPIYVGPQASLGQLTSPASQGTSAAEAAVSDAESRGIEPGATLYDDMEAYSSSDNSAVVSFVSAWTTELHRYQYESGIYSSSDSGVSQLASTFSTPPDTAPDVIYDALWNGDANTSDSNIPAG